MIRKRGSTIIESIVGMAIILIIGTIIFGLTINLKNSRKVRSKFEFYDRVAYSVENEIKYNIDYNTILNILTVNENISLKLNKDYFNFIMKNDLLNLSSGTGINIRKTESPKEKLLKIEICIKDGNNRIISLRNFVKGDF